MTDVHVVHEREDGDQSHITTVFPSPDPSSGADEVDPSFLRLSCAHRLASMAEAEVVYTGPTPPTEYLVLFGAGPAYRREVLRHQLGRLWRAFDRWRHHAAYAAADAARAARTDNALRDIEQRWTATTLVLDGEPTAAERVSLGARTMVCAHRPAPLTSIHLTHENDTDLPHLRTVPIAHLKHAASPEAFDD